MAMTRCKMRCELNEAQGDAAHLRLSPVYDPNPDSENGQFFKYTPSGQLELWVVNPAVSAQFEVGKEYYIDIADAPRPVL